MIFPLSGEADRRHARRAFGKWTHRCLAHVRTLEQAAKPLELARRRKPFEPALSPFVLRRIRLRDTETRRTLVFLTNPVRVAGRDHLRALQEPLASRTVLQMDQAASADQGFLRLERKRGEDPDLDRRVSLRARSHRP